MRHTTYDKILDSWKKAGRTGFIPILWQEEGLTKAEWKELETAADPFSSDFEIIRSLHPQDDPSTS